MFDDKMHQNRQRFRDLRIAFQIQMFDRREQRVDLVDILKEFVLIIDFRTGMVNAVGVVFRDLQITHHLFLVIHPF